MNASNTSTKDKNTTTLTLYDQDAYATQFNATVVSCEESKKGFAVVLDQTLFFPEEGGQSPDKGTLNGIEVCDVQIKKDIITHTLKQPLLPGTAVSGKLNWEHRFSNMQQHSGEHLFSGLVNRYLGYNNVGFHLSDQIVTMDFDGPLTAEDIAKIEWEVNDAISRNIATEVTFPSKEELASMDYRSKIEIEGQVRIVTYPGYDVCACCAPHVKQTGEIGILKVVSVQNYKGGMRISILCGFRALEDYRQKHSSVLAISNALSAKQEDISNAVAKLSQENIDLKRQLTALQLQIMEQKIAAISSDCPNVCLFEENLDMKTARETVNHLTESHPGYCGIFIGNDARGYQYVVGSSSLDARELSNQLKELFHAKGGGSAAMIQGSLSGTKDELEKLF